MDTDDATTPDPGVHGDRTRRRGGWRRWALVLATTVTVVALAVCVVLAGTWMWRLGRQTDAWATRFGDPTLSLADGVVLPTDPVPTEQWRVRRTTYGLPEDTGLLAEAFGGPVRQVGKRSWATATGEVSISPLTHDDPVSQAYDAARMSGWLEFRAPLRDTWPGQPTFPTAQARQDEVVRIYRLLGWPDDPGQMEVAALGDDLVFRVTLRVPGTQSPDDPRLIGLSSVPGVEATFTPDGRLQQLAALLVLPERRVPVEAVSAAQAFDDLRHHRDGAMWLRGSVPSLATWVRESAVGEEPGSDASSAVAGWALVAERMPVPEGEDTGITVATWLFLDGAGGVVGTMQATPPIRPVPEEVP